MIDECIDRFAVESHEKMAEKSFADIFTAEARENVVSPAARRRSHREKILKFKFWWELILSTEVNK